MEKTVKQTLNKMRNLLMKLASFINIFKFFFKLIHQITTKLIQYFKQIIFKIKVTIKNINFKILSQKTISLNYVFALIYYHGIRY